MSRLFRSLLHNLSYIITYCNIYQSRPLVKHVFAATALACRCKGEGRTYTGSPLGAAQYNQTLSRSGSTGVARGLCILLKHRLFTTSSPRSALPFRSELCSSQPRKCPKNSAGNTGMNLGKCKPTDANVCRRDLSVTINTYEQMGVLNGKKACREPVEVNYTQVYQQPMLICSSTIESLVQLPTKLPAAFLVRNRQDALKLVCGISTICSSDGLLNKAHLFHTPSVI